MTPPWVADVLLVAGTILYVGGWILIADHVINDRGADRDPDVAPYGGEP